MLPHAIRRVEQPAIYFSEFSGLMRPAGAECASFRPRSGVSSKLPVIPLSRIHLTWASYFSVRDWDTSAGLTVVGTEASNKLRLNFFRRRKSIDLLLLLAWIY